MRVALSARRGFTRRSMYSASCFRKKRFSAASWARDRIPSDTDRRDRGPRPRSFEADCAQAESSRDRSYADHTSLICGPPASRPALRTPSNRRDRFSATPDRLFRRHPDRPLEMPPIIISGSVIRITRSVVFIRVGNSNRSFETSTGRQSGSRLSSAFGLERSALNLKSPMS